MRSSPAFNLALTALALVLVATVALGLLIGGDPAETGQAADNVRSYVPLAPRAGLPRPVSFRMAVPGGGVALTGTPTARVAGIPTTPTPLPDYLDVQSFEISYDGALTFALDVRGDLAGAPSTGFLAFDLIGRPAEVGRTPAMAMDLSCQVSPRSEPKQFTVIFNGFPGDELIDVGIHQIGGDEDFSNILAPVSGDPFGNGRVSFFFFSDQTKDWLVTGTARASRARATTAFRTSVNEACPPPVPPAFGASPIADGPSFFADSSFDLRVARSNGVWGGELRRWDGRGWQRVRTFDSWQVAGRTVRMTAPPGDLGVAGSCIVFGGLSQSYPTAGSPVGKAILLDPRRGPLASFCLNPDSGSLAAGGAAAEQIVVEAWSGCGGSDAGLIAPPCAPPLVAERGAAQATPTQGPPRLVAVTSRGVSPSACSTPTSTATDCPAVGMTIWIRPDGSASLQPYSGFGPWTWFVTTSPPSPSRSVSLVVFPEDYARIPALRIIPIGLAENQALLGRYRGTFEPQTSIALNAAGAGSYSYSPVALGQLYRHMVCDLRGLFTFSQLPLTFQDGGSASKFILDIGAAYDPTYRCS